jgi:hypothetical protein
MRTARALTVVLIFMVSLVTLSTRLESSAAAATSPSQDALHEVLPGDNLRLIAGYYYGDARQWERIWNANRDQVRNPNRIERGAFLRIPDATAPTESYADFFARAQRPLPPHALTIPAVPPIPPAEARVPDGPSASPEPPAKPSPARVALPAPTKAPAPGAGPTAPAPTPAPVAAPPQKAAAPAAPPAPQPTKAPAVAATPPGAQPPSPAPTKQAAAPAAPQPAKAAGPSARPAPPPPPKAWYEEWGLDELAASPLFLGGVAVVVLGLAAILLIRRRRSAASAVAEVPE